MENKRWLYAGVGTIIMLFAGLIYAWSVLASPISAFFTDWTQSQISLTFTICMSFFCIGGLCGGLLAKKVNVKMNMILSGIFLCAGFLISSRTDSLAMLYIGYGILAGFGYSNIEVKKKINTAIISTGNEISNIGESLKEGQIYDANAPMLVARTSALSCNSKFYGKVNDDEKEIKEILSKALEENDIVLISGGVSMGDFDYVHKELLELGVNQIFHGVAMKPGKPLFFGKLGKKAVFALPGNTVSSFMTFEIMVKPYILNCLGINYDTNYINAVISEDFKRKDTERLEYIPVHLFFDDTKLLVKLIKYNNSSMISSFSEANGILKIDIGISDIVKGSIVDVRFL